MNNKSLIILLVLAVFLVTGCKETHNRAIDIAYQLTATKGGKTKCDERKDDGNVGKELMERELGEIEGAEGCHNQM